MSIKSVRELASEFAQGYDSTLKDEVWKQQSTAFRRFWGESILNLANAAPSDDQCDAVIRFLDRNGKGNTKTTEAVARAMIPQGAWRRMFAGFRSDLPLGKLVNSILIESDPGRKGELIDRLYAVNEGKKNHLTGASGNAINALLAAFDPLENLSVISLKDRRALIEYFALPAPLDWASATIGAQIVVTNRVLIERLKAESANWSARSASVFCYWKPFKDRWKPEHTAKRSDKDVTVTVPEKTDDESEELTGGEIRESLQIQALLSQIGALMGLKIWLPKSDRVRVLKKWAAQPGDLLDELPLNYDDATLKTIEQIDVLWLRRRSIVRAFEVEHTTSVYSGLLRMADLIALQPNMAINLHIVAPASRRDKVFDEIGRPVFSLLEGRPLAEMCTYLSYESVRSLADLKHLGHLSDSVVEDYAESALS